MHLGHAKGGLSDDEAIPLELEGLEFGNLLEVAEANTRIYLGFERGGLHVDGAEDKRDVS